MSLSDILNTWEEERKGWWFGYYQDFRFPKLQTHVLKPLGIIGVKKYYKKAYCNMLKLRKKRVLEVINKQQMKQSTKEKPRWSSARKARGY